MSIKFKKFWIAFFAGIIVCTIAFAFGAGIAYLSYLISPPFAIPLIIIIISIIVGLLYANDTNSY